MTEPISTASARCGEGWRLFWILGDLYTAEIMKAPHERNWKNHVEAIAKHRDHINNCQTCNFGITRVQIKLNELAVEHGP